MKVEKSIEIAASPEKVWPFLAESEKVRQWYFPLQRFEYIGELQGHQATRLHFEEKVAGQVMKLNCEVTGWQENKRVAFRMMSGNVMKSYQERWTLEPIPSGTRFTFMEEGELPYWIVGQILGLFVKASSVTTVGKMLARLKALAEA